MSRDILMPVSIDDVSIPEGRREVDPAVVKRLADSIESIGLKHPITVRRKGEQYILVAGLHRLKAHEKLGREHVPACIVSMTNAEARMWEIAENLHRANLNNIQRAEQIEEWRELKAAQAANSSHPSGGKQPEEAGVSKTAEALGVSRGTVQNAKKIASISEEAKDAAQQEGVVGTRELLEIAKEPPERQVAKVRELVLPKTDADVIEQQFAALMSAWNKASPEARQRFREVIDEPVMDKRFA